MTLHESYGSAARAVAASAEDEAQAAVAAAQRDNRKAPQLHQHLVDAMKAGSSARPDPALDPPSTLALRAHSLDRAAQLSRRVEYFRPNAPYVLHLSSIAQQSRSMQERNRQQMSGGTQRDGAGDGS